MILRFAAAAVFILAASACSRDAPVTGDVQPGGSDRAAEDQHASADSSVVGKIAPSLATPQAIIVLEPQGGASLPVKPEPAIMDQAGYEFLPAFLLAQAGQQVQFRNSEDVLHNVRVTEISSQTPVFNVATLASGKYEHTFEPGYYNVTCDIHSTMQAGILVTASPYTATTGDDGGFTISDVQPGSYNLTIYAGAPPIVRPIEIKSGRGRTDLGEIR